MVSTACGNGASPVATVSPTPSSTAQAIPTPTAGAAQPDQLIVLAEGASPTSGATSLKFVTPGGKVVANYPLKPGVAVLAAAGKRVFVNTQDGELEAIGRDGTVADLGPVGPGCPCELVPSPDGTRWLWGTGIGLPGGTSQWSSQIYLGGIGLPNRIVAEYVSDRYLMPYTWTASGVLVQHTYGVGGYFAFDLLFSPIARLNLETGTLTTLPVGDCRVSDVAPDGTIACFAVSPTEPLHLVAPNGATTSVPLAHQQFNQMGDAWFDPSGTVLTVAWAKGVGGGMFGENGGTPPQPEEYTTYLVRLDGSIVQFGPAGVRPALGAQSWLSPQQLVLWRPSGAAGGEAGLYVLDLDGHSTFIADTGRPVGVIS